MRPHFNRSTALLFIVPGLFCVVGLALLAPAIWFGYQSWAFLQSAQAVPGSVTALDWSNDTASSGARPVVSYELRGEPYQIAGTAWANPPAYAVGDPVQVLYPPDQPRAARIYSWFEFWFLPTLLGGIGLVFALVGSGVGYLIWRSMGMS
jgi:Protein of unknown function (DUF3592)